MKYIIKCIEGQWFLFCLKTGDVCAETFGPFEEREALQFLSGLRKFA